MGRDLADVRANDKAAANNDQFDVSRYLLSDTQANSVRLESTAPPPNLVPTSGVERMWDVTKEGVKQIPQGFMNSLDYHNILPNVGTGLVIGAATRLALAEGGPVAKIAGGALTAYFLGKPLAEVYSSAYTAETPEEMKYASSMLGNALGGLPVSMAEGMIGARVGSGVAGKLLSTEAAAPFVEWKANQYAKLDSRIDNLFANTHNYAFEKMGIGTPVMKAASVHSIIPPYLLEELAKRNPNNPAYMDTMKHTASFRSQRLGSNFVNTAEDTGGARSVYDAKGQEDVGVKVRSEGQPKTGDAEVDNVYDYTGDVRSYYKDVHHRNSIDGKGMPLESTVNYGQNFENAFWDGSRMTYGRPGAESPFKSFISRGITGHEMTHGVTEFESGLQYRNQSGALNESHSDVFGALIEQRALGQTADQASWLVGDGIWKDNIQGKALRDMLNPGKAYDDPAIGKDPQPANMKDYVNTRRDNGGVHINSGIPNRAFALFAKSVGGNAWEAPGEIWYRAREMAGSTPSFAQFAYQTIAAAKELGHTDLVPKLQKAWVDGVGVKPSATDNAGSATVPIVNDTNPDKNKPQNG